MGSRRRFLLVLAVGFTGALAAAGTARAHGTSVETPPIPAVALLAGAAIAVGATAVALTVGPDPPTGRVRLGTIGGRTAKAGKRVVRAAVVACLAGVVVSGLTETAAVTFATVFVWPVLFKGSLVVAALVGSPWRVVSPWEMAYDAVVALEGEAVALYEYPERLGSWPAVLGVALVVGVVENLTVVPDDGRLTVVFLAIYTLFAFLGALAFGREFFERADAFTVLYRLAGRVAPIAFERNGDAGTESERESEADRVVVFARPPWVASARPLADLGLAAFVVVAVATVTFDGAVETTTASRALAGLEGVVGAAGGVVLYVAFVAAFLAGAGLVRRAVTAAAGSPLTGQDVRADGSIRPGGAAVESGPGARTVATALAATLLPIAVAYDVAHNYPYVLVNASRALSRALAALGAPVAPDPSALLGASVVWTVQVGLVLGGHVVAVVAAHVATERAFPDARSARRGHAPLAALMVAYTVASLYVLAVP